MKEQSQRRGRRYTNDMSVELFIRDESTSTSLVGPAHCYLRDLSSYGAGLILPKIQFGGQHLFYTPEEKEELQLYLEHEINEEETISIPVRPIWFKLDETEEARYFSMGIEFLVDSNDTRIASLKKLSTARISEGKGWLSKALLKFITQLSG